MTRTLPRRCAWCKRFLKKGTALYCWRAEVPEPNRQRATSKYNYWARLLCPTCRPSTETLWWKYAAEEDVARLRPEGLPADDPRWQPPADDSPLLALAPGLMFGTDEHERVRL